MIFTDFISQTTGHAVTYDHIPANYGQCEQLVQLYEQEVQNLPIFVTPYAKNYWVLFKGSPLEAYYDQIPVGQPIESGDIVVFGPSTVINSPLAGHIDICVTPFGGSFTGFDSNWGNVKDQNKGTPGYGYPAAHEVQHSFIDVLGYLRAKGELMYPNKGDVVNAYVYVGETAQPADITLYTSKPWNAPDGLFYGKTRVDLQNQNSQITGLNTELAQMKAPVNLTPGVYKV